MTPMEEFKRKFEIAAKDTNVRFGQARDHLIWTRSDDDGSTYNVYIFWLKDETGSVVQIYPRRSNFYDSAPEFLDAIAEWRASIEHSDYELQDRNLEQWQ